jgi:hypothetical protein
VLVGEEFEENMFGVGALIEESSHPLVIESYHYLRGFLFFHLHVLDLLAWWCIHEG